MVDVGGGMTVRDVLAVDVVAGWDPEVVAGGEALGRTVRWVHVAEAVDVAEMLIGGEVVLTTGLLLAGDAKAQTAYVESMHRAEAAAVFLGLGRAFTKAPEPMRRAAARRGLPLVVLRRPAPFARLTEEVLARLVHREFEVVSLSDRVRGRLCALNLDGAALRELMTEIARFAGCPVVLTNLAHRVLATAGEQVELEDVLRDWNRVSRLLGAGGAVPEGWTTAVLEGHGRRWGVLVLCGHRLPEDVARVIAERAAEALVMERLLADRQGAPDWEHQAAQTLLADLAQPTSSPQQLLARARAAGLPVDRRQFVPLVVRRAGTALPPEPAERVAGVLGRVLAEVELAGLVAHLGEGGTAVLLSVGRDQDAERAVRRFAERARERLRGVVIGAGFACPLLEQVRPSLQEALHVAEVGASGGAPHFAGPVLRLRDVRLPGLVRQLRDAPQLQEFAERELGPLLEPAHRELLPVLRTYLASGLDKSRTAQRHHMSRPALYRRLESIESLLGVDLHDFGQAASLYTALLSHDAQEGVTGES
jgi:purine catabolism regulator